MSVIEFKPRVAQNDEPDPYATGPAFCIDCGYEWNAVAPLGTTQLECPKCHTLKGKLKFEFYPPEGSLVRECNCGNQLFYLTAEGHMCANCGTYQAY